MEDRIDQKDEQEGEPQGHWDVAQGDARGTQAVGGVGGEPADNDGEHETDENGSRGDGLCERMRHLRCSGLGLWLAHRVMYGCKG